MSAQLMELTSFVAGEWLATGGESDVVTDKFDDSPVARMYAADAEEVRRAVSALVEAQSLIRLTQRARADILARAAELVRERRSALIPLVQRDAGFVRTDAEKEVDRTAETLTLCSEEAKRLAGHLIPMEGAAGGAGRFAYTRLDPLGVICAITPFNSPLNTVAHKVGPAIAAGNAVILKPAAQTPASADAFVRVLLDAGLPPELISLVHGPGSSVGQWLTEDQRLAYYAFTGSTAVGRRIHSAVGMRPTQLEMGSLASTIICADADLDKATSAAVNGTLRKSGQVCTSVQRLYVHESVRTDVEALLTEKMRAQVAGDPYDTATLVGPLIAPREAERVERWIAEATEGGADVLTGGRRAGNVVEPTVLSNASERSRVMRDELFGPVVVLRGFADLGRAIAEANDTPYGLASGIFTRDIDSALTAADKMITGSVYINDTSGSRVDMMPFAGLKESGFGGPEGPAYAIRDMSMERVISIRRP
ncbi:aldehyde dehydrogenase family protein [Actinomadura sp. LOL_016]|uniref:aldehyde dehydrogenase family protein n=1 Tax=unclassified Actinomadura TaxID=2626254 RepID=UPI003A8059A0